MNIKNVFFLSAPIFIITLLVLPASAQQAYRWVDQHGTVHFSDQPPPPLAREVTTKNFAINNTDSDSPDLPFTVRKAAKDFPVTLFTGTGCDTLCDNARALLRQRGIPFSEQVITTDEEYDDYKKRFNSTVVPILTVGNHSSTGFESSAWNTLLDNAGYPKTASGQIQKK